MWPFFVTKNQAKNSISILFNYSKFHFQSVNFTPVICNYSNIKELNDETIKLLEKLSLVNFENQKHISIVEDAIKFADKIQSINTENIEPLITVLEDENLKLRSDVVTVSNYQKNILRNAKITEEDYFVAPPGNIPIVQDIPKASS